MWARNKKQTGFTIIELLIVIVVIGILAAITIVAYNGIQVRAENTKTVNAVGQYAKAVSIHQTINGVYPIVSIACLGTTSCSQVTDGVSTCFGTGGAGRNTTFDTSITASLNIIPQLSLQKMNCGGKEYSGGLYYSATDGKSGGFYYYLKGSQQCTSIGGLNSPTRAQQDDTTLCIATLPSIN